MLRIWEWAGCTICVYPSGRPMEREEAGVCVREERREIPYRHRSPNQMPAAVFRRWVE